MQSILEEERKAYALETDRLTEELENVRNIESDCRAALDQAENRCKELEKYAKEVDERLENTFMLHMGDGADIVSVSERVRGMGRDRERYREGGRKMRRAGERESVRQRARSQAARAQRSSSFSF